MEDPIWQISQKGIFKQIYIEKGQIKCFCQTPVLGLGLGVDFTFALDNIDNNEIDNTWFSWNEQQG